MARPRKFDERSALLTARALFWHRGYEGTSIADLRDATGVASQSIYGAFGNKHDLFMRTLNDYCDEQIGGLEAGYHASSSPLTWLMSAVAFEDGGRLDLTTDGCYLSGSTAALARLDSDVNAVSQRSYERILIVFAEAVARAQRVGEVREDVDAQEAAVAFLVSMQGLEFIGKSGIEEAFLAAKASVISSLHRAFGTAEVAVDGSSAIGGRGDSRAE